MSEEKKIERVVSPEEIIRVKKKNGLKKMSEQFFPDDAKTVGSYILTDVIIPEIKRILDDAFHAILWGRGTGRSSSKSSGSSSLKIVPIDYTKPGKAGNQQRTDPRLTYDFEEFVVRSRGKAEEVLFQMKSIIDHYGTVTVADYYEIIAPDDSNPNWAANNYGWSDLSSAYVDRTKDGYYYVNLPKAIPLSK